MTRGVIIFWCAFLLLIVADYASLGHPRREPAPFALGSDRPFVGGHCSGR
jgi:hypothetical protein